MNDEVKQAFDISDADKQLALKIYKQAVIKLVNKNYLTRVNDSHTELSAIFGVDWLCAKKTNYLAFFSAQIYAQANIAFNYANIKLGMNGKFIETAKELVKEDERVSDLILEEMTEQMNYLLTFTNTEGGMIANYM